MLGIGNPKIVRRAAIPTDPADERYPSAGAWRYLTEDGVIAFDESSTETHNTKRLGDLLSNVSRTR